MSYCTQADLLSRYGEQDVRLRSDRERTGVLDEATVAAALARADADIDGALTDAGYPTPLAAAWSRARVHAETRAMVYLYCGDTLPKELADAWAASERWLEKVAVGAMRPPGVAQDAQLAVGMPDYVVPERVFDADTLDAIR